MYTKLCLYGLFLLKDVVDKRSHLESQNYSHLSSRGARITSEVCPCPISHLSRDLIMCRQVVTITGHPEEA